LKKKTITIPSTFQNADDQDARTVILPVFCKTVNFGAILRGNNGNYKRLKEKCSGYKVSDQFMLLMTRNFVIRMGHLVLVT
jgi:hypothetical protein